MRTHTILAILSGATILAGCNPPEKPKENNGNPPAPGIESHLEQQNFAQIMEKAQKGDAAAEFELASMYEFGDGTEQNLPEAITWYTKAAAQNNRQANFNLGMMYKEGRGTAQNYDKATRYFLAAEKLGEVRSALQLGLMYYSGTGVEKNLAEAKKHFETAAMGGLGEAQVNLGVMYVRAEATETQDPIEAYAWFLVAKENASAKGADFAEKLKEQLQPEQVTEAEERKAELQAKIRAMDKNTR